MKQLLRRFVASLLVSLVVGVAQAQEIASPTLDTVRDRGRVVCGVNNDQRGFSTANSLGEYSGLNVDLCRAISAMIFGNPDNAKFVAITAANQFESLSSGKIDVLISNAAWRFDTNVSIGNYAGISFFDGQGFLVWKRSGIRTALELDNTSICVIPDSLSEQYVKEFFTTNQLRYKPVSFDNDEAAKQAYSEGACTVLSATQSSLASLRVSQVDPNAHRLLGSLISKEPLGPIVRANDSGWENVARWSLNCMINAEELGISSENVDRFIQENTANGTISTRHLLGQAADLGAQFSIENDWCATIVRAVGNYGEAYERHLGADSTLQLSRGINKLWSNGGLLYAPPIR